ncbi:hypothetical protein B0G81_0366 [Paraburkholderia sp. BL6665CI2N2]|nr:hypothetical protein B0G81_0366 [Paraburkholderia sp. BL6665CI2N2]
MHQMGMLGVRGRDGGYQTCLRNDAVIRAQYLGAASQSS